MSARMKVSEDGKDIELIIEGQTYCSYSNFGLEELEKENKSLYIVINDLINHAYYIGKQKTFRRD